MKSTHNKSTFSKAQKNKTKKNKMAQLGGNGLFKPEKAKTKSSTQLIDTSVLLKNLNIDNMNPEDYIASPQDEIQYVKVQAVSLLKKFGGRGLFAEKKISRGTRLGLYTGQEYQQDQFAQFLETDKNANSHYALQVQDRIIDAQTKGNFTRYINFSDTQANTTFVETSHKTIKKVEVRAMRTIQPGEQLLVDYNIHDENGLKHYYFLNPDDGFYSAAALLKENSNLYFEFQTRQSMPALGLKNGDVLYITRVLQAILNDKPLSKLKTPLVKKELALSCLRANSDKSVIDFGDEDVFTPLMLASFMGQINNVKLLVNRGVNINQQQHQSGMCPLFFALEGYQSNPQRRGEYIAILIILIKAGANVLTHDRNSRTLLYKAADVLQPSDFKLILSKIDSKTLSKICFHIDEEENDIVMYCVKNKALEPLVMILKASPEYIKQNFLGKDTDNNEFHQECLNQALQTYSDDDKECLLSQFRKHHLSDALEVFSKIENKPGQSYSK